VTTPFQSVFTPVLKCANCDGHIRTTKTPFHGPWTYVHCSEDSNVVESTCSNPAPLTIEDHGGSTLTRRT
jgi:hypothetical protein